MWALARETTISPVSIGWRRVSRTERGNSGNSSMKSTPLCARLISPGASGASAADDGGHRGGVMGSRKGRVREMPPSSKRPDREWIIEVSNASVGLSGGRIEGDARGEHGFARAGRADHDQVMAPGGCDFKRAFGAFLSLHVAQVAQLRVGQNFARFGGGKR